ncbi:Renal dipeptidase [Bacillus sp. AFS006103]|nr:Renal dipeptidase [Bacillus sp. AFS006103]
MTDKNLPFDIHSLSRELQFLLVCMKASSEGEYVTELEPWLPDIDWKHFLDLVQHHRVYPLVYMTLKKLKKGSVPTDVLQELADKYLNNTLKMLRLSMEMDRLFKLFDEYQIQALMLKGPVLAKDLYGDLSLRTSKDLDILVQQKDVMRTEELLLQLGYLREGEALHHFSYLHSTSTINIEIHWRLHPEIGQEPAFQDLWERRRISSLSSYPISFFGKEDLFLFLVSHGARHGWFRLRWLGDIDLLVRKRLNWDYLIPQLTELRFHHMAGQALILTHQLLHTPIPSEMQLLTKGYEARKLAQIAFFYIREMRHTDPVIPLHELVYGKYYSFSLIPNHKQKWSFIIRSFYPQSADKETLPLPESLHALYFPLRPWLWLWRRVNRA